MGDSLTPHPRTLTEAHWLNAAFTIGYVGPLYLSRFTNPSSSKPESQLRDGWRNDPNVIKARLLFVSISTVLSCIAMHWVVNSGVDGEGQRLHKFRVTAMHLGFTLSDRDLPSYFVTPSLFLGPLYVLYLGGSLPFMTNWTLATHLYERVFTWQGVRNFIFGPLTEELVWRSCVIAAYHLAGASRNQMIFLTPLSFGAAHLHHGYETFTRFGRTFRAFQIALINMLFQFAYTTLFGFHCAFLFIRTGSVFVPMVAHIFCNIMGVPQLAQEVHYYPRKATQIKAMYLLGIFAYIYTMRHWTLRSDNVFWTALDR